MFTNSLYNKHRIYNNHINIVPTIDGLYVFICTPKQMHGAATSSNDVQVSSVSHGFLNAYTLDVSCLPMQTQQVSDLFAHSECMLGNEVQEFLGQSLTTLHNVHHNSQNFFKRQTESQPFIQAVINDAQILHAQIELTENLTAHTPNYLDDYVRQQAPAYIPLSLSDVFMDYVIENNSIHLFATQKENVEDIADTFAFHGLELQSCEPESFAVRRAMRILVDDLPNTYAVITRSNNTLTLLYFDDEQGVYFSVKHNLVPSQNLKGALVDVLNTNNIIVDTLYTCDFGADFSYAQTSLSLGCELVPIGSLFDAVGVFDKSNEVASNTQESAEFAYLVGLGMASKEYVRHNQYTQNQSKRSGDKSILNPLAHLSVSREDFNFLPWRDQAHQQQKHAQYKKLLGIFLVIVLGLFVVHFYLYTQEQRYQQQTQDIQQQIIQYAQTNTKTLQVYDDTIARLTQCAKYNRQLQQQPINVANILAQLANKTPDDIKLDYFSIQRSAPYVLSLKLNDKSNGLQSTNDEVQSTAKAIPEAVIADIQAKSKTYAQVAKYKKSLAKLDWVKRIDVGNVTKVTANNMLANYSFAMQIHIDNKYWLPPYHCVVQKQHVADNKDNTHTAPVTQADKMGE